ncbi:MAG: adenylyltransferase/cytidyltransferase family protein [Acidobacteriota bacterium]|nr:adenylyltransferase/cytidyltransferase family protein [Acidobacteriota bacterium]
MEKIRTLDQLIVSRRQWGAEGRTVVWTNGCFDLLHVGHLRGFRDARALGDILIVGINSDASVRANKGGSRPVVNEADRAEMLAALEMVDYVTIFNEPTPVQALSRLRPDIHCKGAEYADGARPVPELDTVLAYGGQVRFLPFHPGRSTSALIERIIAAGQDEESTCGK